MLGIVFTSLIDMLEDKVSPEFADEVIVEANLVRVRPTADYRVHSEMPAIVTDDQGNNLGKQLLAHGRRLGQFPIEASLALLRL